MLESRELEAIRHEERAKEHAKSYRELKQLWDRCMKLEAFIKGLAEKHTRVLGWCVAATAALITFFTLKLVLVAQLPCWLAILFAVVGGLLVGCSIFYCMCSEYPNVELKIWKAIYPSLESSLGSCLAVVVCSASLAFVATSACEVGSGWFWYGFVMLCAFFMYGSLLGVAALSGGGSEPGESPALGGESPGESEPWRERALEPGCDPTHALKVETEGFAERQGNVLNVILISRAVLGWCAAATAFFLTFSTMDSVLVALLASSCLALLVLLAVFVLIVNIWKAIYLRRVWICIIGLVATSACGVGSGWSWYGFVISFALSIYNCLLEVEFWVACESPGSTHTGISEESLRGVSEALRASQRSLYGACDVPWV